jgi:hypothetical protein
MLVSVSVSFRCPPGGSFLEVFRPKFRKHFMRAACPVTSIALSTFVATSYITRITADVLHMKPYKKTRGPCVHIDWLLVYTPLGIFMLNEIHVRDAFYDTRGSRVRFPAGAGNFSLHHRVQNGSGAQPASYPMDTRGSVPGGRAAGELIWPLTSI